MPWSTPKRILAILLAIIGAAYPVLAYYGLSHFSTRIVLGVLLVLLVARAVLFLVSRKIAAALVTLAVAAIITGISYQTHMQALRMYPVLINLVLAGVFALSLKYPPPVIERFARLRHPDLDDYGIAYTRKLTGVWVAFFVCSAGIATATALWGTLEEWTLYNGFISYVLTGIFFIGEWPVRRWLRRRHENRISGA
ncbi:hypothetical protein TH25_08285 [Thalassospira profundimaris]|uniref:DNA gyrase subunit B n=1 Tax=Thalassospira profundimaris TaxID=502049 RepID=A0A367XDK1_9PROT|nr:hypothetical protein [Thalassospira profundimaris]RCK51677.1 hypothetical protein TH25_08285 [Thalassospira profundimaris]